jgi:hypothetical protein
LWQYPFTRITNKDALIGYLQTAIAKRKQHRSVPFIVDESVNQMAGCTRYGNFSFTNTRVGIGWTGLASRFNRPFPGLVRVEF